MNTFLKSAAFCALLAGCSGGNPFQPDTGTGGDGDTRAIPDELAQNMQSFSYDPNEQTLTVTGVPTDDGPLDGVYRRRPGLDRAGYEAYTAQDGSLDRHVTAYVRDIRGTRAAMVVTGGQFEQIFVGGAYGNTNYTSPVPPGSTGDGGLVTYAGTYVGMLNTGGSNEDLLPVAPGTPIDVRSVQSAEVTGNMVMTGDFMDSSVTGVIFERRVLDYNNADQSYDPFSTNPLQVQNVALDSTAIEADGTFFGTLSQDNGGVGSYGGIFGGNGATEVAGLTTMSGHIEGFSDIIENGVFVLSQCGQPGEDPVCDQPVP